MLPVIQPTTSADDLGVRVSGVVGLARLVKRVPKTTFAVKTKNHAADAERKILLVASQRIA
jgi:hypothetical protein